MAVRHEVFDGEESAVLHERLQKRLFEETEGSMFEAAYEKLTSSDLNHLNCWSLQYLQEL